MWVREGVSVTELHVYEEKKNSALVARASSTIQLAEPLARPRARNCDKIHNERLEDK